MNRQSQASELSPEWQQMEYRVQLADALSKSLLFSLERQYLDVPFEKASYIQPQSVVLGKALNPPAFLRLEQVGSLGAGLLHQPFTALQTALSACHHAGRYTLIFIVVGDGQKNHLYLGVQSQDPKYDAEDFVRYLGDFLQGNWPGIRFQICEQNSRIFQDQVQRPMKQLNYSTALTGIPSLKPGDSPGYPQSLDRLLRGLRGGGNKPYIYMVIAEPMAQTEINDIIYRGRDLVGRVHMLTKTSLTETLTTTMAQTEGQTDTSHESYTEQTGESEGSSSRPSRLVGAVGGAAAVLGGTAALGLAFPPAAFANLLLGAIVGGAGIGDFFGSSHQTSTSTSRGINRGISQALSQSQSFSLSEAQAIGKEYLNAHAQAVEKQLQQYITRFEQGRATGSWNVGVYFLAKRPDIIQQGATQLRALLSGEKSSYEPIRIHNLQRVWTGGVRDALQNFERPKLALINPQKEEEMLEHPLGPAFNSLTTPINTEELALLVNFPRREVPGIQVMPTTDFSLNPPNVEGDYIQLGHLLEGGEQTSLSYNISLNTLAKHTLVTGITGSGKSTTCHRLLNELHRQQTPFLVIEPAKDEYIEWAMRLNESLPPNSPDRIAVYMPGATKWRGQKLENVLHLNPFDIVWLAQDIQPEVLPHIDRLKSILIAAFPMQEVLPVLLEEVLFHAYNKPRNWLTDELPPFDAPRPTLSQLVDQIQTVVRSRGYDKPITANLTAALITRIQSLRRGWKGKIFDQPQSTSWDKLFDRPVIINLSRLGDDADKAFAMAVLLQFLYEYRQTQYDSSTGQGREALSLNHLTIIEEAHRILLRPTPGLPNQANPQSKMAEMFANILSEIRAYGQGMLIVDQVPSKLIPDAVKNTNLKIVHRLVANDDREAMAGAMTLTAEQSAIINRLRPGQAIVSGDQDDMTAWVQVEKE